VSVPIANPVTIFDCELVIRGPHAGLIHDLVKTWATAEAMAWRSFANEDDIRMTFRRDGDLERVRDRFGPWAHNRSFRNRYTELPGGTLVQAVTDGPDGETTDLASTF